ncbi:hypothetical protein NE237_003354 [Protea cynaroides]|uniref:Uncharacterized protein n=1 Tax=Protea cynaroides TaxID=273540 RepID=A0A9Q0QSC6_9MAGN|nr:hypothetical protein NE237_003354 [Protea cynaroides]
MCRRLLPIGTRVLHRKPLLLGLATSNIKTTSLIEVNIRSSGRDDMNINTDGRSHATIGASTSKSGGGSAMKEKNVSSKRPASGGRREVQGVLNLSNSTEAESLKESTDVD